ncbi:MAG TPA: hypothetical protein ENG96_07210 [Gammaproteobacteria bacterium]|nr:hypothetical protein [Gammaproteobacteria bacterium]
MKKKIEQKIKIITLGLLALLLLTGPVAYAADDPSIKGDLRTDIQATMDTFIKSQTIDGTLRLYDPVEDVLLKVTLKKLHPGIVKKGNFFVSCADFVDSKGRKYDLDFLVVPAGDKLITTQAIVHSVDGKKRKYHLE